MNKRNILVIISCFLVATLIVIFATGMFFFKKHTCDDGKLIINGQIAEDVDIKMNFQRYSSHYEFPYFLLNKLTNAELPFLYIFEELGGKVEWVNDDVAKLSYNNRRYTLTLSEDSLMEEGEFRNLLRMTAFGSKIYCYKQTKGDVVLDNWSVDRILNHMGMELEVSVDYSKKTTLIGQSGQSGDGSLIDKSPK